MSSGSSALVGSSRSSTRGLSASARAMPTRCCWPPESCRGSASARGAMPTFASNASAASSACGLGVPVQFSGPATLVRADRWLKRLKCWKTIPMPSCWRCSAACRAEGRRPALVEADPGAGHRDRAAVDVLEPVDHLQQRALAGATRPQQRNHLTRPDAQVHAVEDGVVAVRLAHSGQADQLGPDFAGCGRVEHGRRRGVVGRPGRRATRYVAAVPAATAPIAGCRGRG